jgi:hypothetical protein
LTSLIKSWNFLASPKLAITSDKKVPTYLNSFTLNGP